MKEESFVQITEDDFESFFELMRKTFPKIEMRDSKGQKEIFKDESYKVIGYKDEENNITAFISLWEFEDFNFIEHFAVDSKLRGNGIGTSFIKDYFNKCHKKIVLEVELPENDIAIRRIEFYKRVNMKFNEYEYVQPPLQVESELLPLRIMSYPEELTKEEFIIIKEKLYHKVYKYKG